jgi:hypothetical protein
MNTVTDRFFQGVPWLVVLLFFISPLYSFGFSVTGGELGLALTPGYNKNYSRYLTLSASGSLEFNELYRLKSGFSLWKAGTTYEIDASTGLRAKLFHGFPLYLYLSYMFNTLPDYEVRIHTVLPLLGISGRYAGITLGTNLRFSSFFDEPIIFESILAFEGYVNFYNTEKFRIGLRAANFNDYSAGNFGSYYLGLNSRIGITESFFLTNGLELRQTGSVGLAFSPYDIAYKVGVVAAW